MTETAIIEAERTVAGQGDRPETVGEVRRRVEELLGEIGERADEVEAARRLPPDLLDRLRRAGCFRLLLPASVGGVEAPLPGALALIAELSRADASVGWSVAVGAGGWVDLAGLPAASFGAVFGPGSDALVAGAFSPSGSAVASDGGFRVRGRWPFVSGSPHAEWIYGNCLEETADGPQLRIALLPRHEVVVEDTWHVLGLRGTGSHHVRIDDVVVPPERTTALFVDEPCVDVAVVRIPTPSLFSLAVASVAIGNAEGAVDEVLGLARTKVPLLAPGALATSATFQRDLARVHGEVAAARASLQQVAVEAWDGAVAGGPPSLEQRARIRAAATLAVERSVEVVASAYRYGGSAAIYDGSPLQRRLRDAYAITQHFLVRADSLTTAGAALAGQPVDVPVF